jgi:uncharacterized protein (TIGR02145 family)
MMKKVSLILCAVILIITSCEKSYDEVQIGNQVWMAENLDVDKFRNGDPIPQAKTDDEWERAGENGEPAWCYYDNDPSHGEKYGKLYNWYAIIDARGLAPEGWLTPSDDDWRVLKEYLGGERTAGTKMKSNIGWSKDGNGTNESGFSGIPGGYRLKDGEFNNIGRSGSWWGRWNDSQGISINPSPDGNAWVFNLDYESDRSKSYLASSKSNGLSVRCIKK